MRIMARVGFLMGIALCLATCGNPPPPPEVSSKPSAVANDADSDGITDTADNCPNLYNPDQADRDGDQLGDVCDAAPATYDPTNAATSTVDVAGNLSNVADATVATPATYGTAPTIFPYASASVPAASVVGNPTSVLLAQVPAPYTKANFIVVNDPYYSADAATAATASLAGYDIELARGAGIAAGNVATVLLTVPKSTPSTQAYAGKSMAVEFRDADHVTKVRVPDCRSGRTSADGRCAQVFPVNADNGSGFLVTIAYRVSIQTKLTADCLIDVSSNLSNCGACGLKCPKSNNGNGAATCTAGVCGINCATGYVLCGGSCYSDTQTNIAHCGNSCTVCSNVVPANSTPVCSAGTCDFSCNAGYVRCGNACYSDTQTNIAHCGNACTVCTTAVANASATCTAGACGFACNSGYVKCGGACYSDTQTNPTHCGNACTVCNAGVANATNTCVAGACDFACTAGYTRCGNACYNDIATNPAHCGNACTVCTTGVANATATCSGGTCGFACNGGYVNCGGACYGDTGTNPARCGNSCTACTTPPNAAATCSGGTCAFACNANYANCNAVAADGCEINLQTDSNNCGACGQSCGAGACQAGACVTPALNCSDLLIKNPSATSGYYLIKPPGAAAPFGVYCDMTTDGGGWTVLYGTDGADGRDGLTGDTATAGNALSYGYFTTTRAQKMLVSASATESLFKRSDGTWLKTNRSLFDQSLATPNNHAHYGVTLTASNGTFAAGFQGYANYNNAGGGDFNLSLADGTNNCGYATVNGVDHHSANYWHLNCNCDRHYLYSYSSVAFDGDSSYKVNTALGSWAATATCSSTEGGGLAFYAATRTKCAAGSSACNGVCVALGSDANNCGTCGNVCPGVTNAAPTCVSSACSFSCSAGYANCDGSAANGCEVNLSNTVSHCGACGQSCGVGACIAGVCQSPATDCRALKVQNSGLPSGVYFIKPAGAPSPFPVYCDMTTDGGGWTLAMKVNGSQATFLYSAAYWQNATTLNPGSPALDGTEAKLQAFSTIPFNQMRLGLAPLGSNYASATSYVTLKFNTTFSSMQTLFSSPTYATQGIQVGASQTYVTSNPRSEWLALLPGASVQSNCNLQGINVGSGTQVRVGYVANQENDCASPDSFIGIGSNQPGGAGWATAGNGVTCCDDTRANYPSNAFNTPSMGFLFIRGPLTCAAGSADCNGNGADACEVNTTNNASNCNGCGTVCAGPANGNGSPACVSSACTVTCNSGYVKCGNLCYSDTGTNPARCGNACSVCTTGVANATATCTGGACGFACNAGYVNCGGTCYSDTATNPAHCGNSCSVCTTGVANATATCAGGTCGFACNAGFINCGGACYSDTATNPAHCGNACTVCTVPANAASTCSGGACGFSCNSGFANCDNGAANGCEINLNTDANNCGGCGIKCGTGTCVLGVCQSAYTDCYAIKTAVAGAASGQWQVKPPGAAAAFPVYCDMTTDGGGWTMVYKLSKGINLDPQAQWFSGTTLNEANTALLDTTLDNADYMNRFVTSYWNAGGFTVDTARLSMYTGGTESAWVQFNASGTTNGTWMTQARVIPGASKYTDVASQASNAFGITGDSGNGRYFFMSQTYGGCPGDTGWMVATRTLPCSWESSRGSALVLLYANASTYQNWQSGAVGVADTMVVWVRPPRTCGAGTGDCDKVGGNACEINTTNNPANCGGCGTVCSGSPNGNSTATCVNSACDYTCNGGYTKCSGGCWNDTATNPAHCGGSCTVCPGAANASASCVSSACSFNCNAGYGNCNGVGGDGCEINFSTDANHCGGCGQPCGIGSCVAGVCQAPATDCRALKVANPALGSGVYFIKPASAASPFLVYCDMTTDGGGWTLAMKVNGALNNFPYSSVYWNGNNTFNAGDPGYNGNEAKLHSFNTVPADQVRLVMVYNGNTGGLNINNLGGVTLLSLFQGGYRNTGLGRNAWKGLFVNGSTQLNCNVEGFNAAAAGAAVRLGIINNQENDCNSPDSFIGIGQNNWGGGGSAGDWIFCCSDEGLGNVQYAAMAYLFVRPALSCAGATRDCNKAGADGCEVNISNNVSNCNGCGIACSGPANGNGSAVCSNYTCGVQCNSGYVNCGNLCYNDTGSNPARCGNSCSVCTTGVANASATCVNGGCSYACNGGYSNCSGQCKNLQSDNNNCGGCGVVCAAGSSCSGGSCVWPITWGPSNWGVAGGGYWGVDQCPAGTVAIGFDATVNGVIRQLQGVCGTMAAASSSGAYGYGPIWSGSDAGIKCPGWCNTGLPGSSWDGGWWTTVAGVSSVCSCVLNYTSISGATYLTNRGYWSGTRAYARCPANQALVGMHSHNGSAIDWWAPRCVSLNSSKQWSSGVTEMAGVGGGGGGDAGSWDCPANQVVTVFQGRSGDWMDTAQIGCQQPH